MPSVKTRTAKKCFIISPSNPEAEQVFKTMLAPACRRLGYAAIRSDEQTSQSIVDGIVTSLAISPMVLAYLGREPWNCNVILEIGYRLATRMPMVLVCDDVPHEKLPFHIASERFVRVPDFASSTSKSRKNAVDKIAAMIEPLIDGNSLALESNQAVAILQAPRGPLRPSKTLYVAASERASRLFGVNGSLIGRSLDQFVREDRRRDMPSYQFQAFVYEQNRLAIGVTPESPAVVARTPIVLKHGPGERRAYLPIIVRFQEVGDIQELTVLYQDVTSVTVWIEDPLLNLGYYVSKLETAAPPLPELVPDPKSNSELPCVFLAHNSLDSDRVRPVYELLRTHNVDPFFDRESIPPGSNFVEAIDGALDCCKAAFVFCGTTGLGRFMGQYEVSRLILSVIEKGIPLIPVLLDRDTQVPTSIRHYNWVSYEEALSDEWMRRFVREYLFK